MKTPTADCERTMSDRTLSFIAPHEAYNRFITESIIFLDACTTRTFDEDDPRNKSKAVEEPPSDDGTMDEDEDEAMPTLPTSWAAVAPKPQAYTPEGMLPGSAWLDVSLPLTEAAEVAHRHVMEELTPDHAHKALILFDEVERARALHTWLIAQGYRRVLAVSRADLKRTHGFLFYPGAQCLRLPNEICPGRLYLGPASSANEQALKLLGITAVVSLLDRHFHLPDLNHHKLIRIADTCGADLDAALRVALPFIHRELAQPNGRVLVHCEAGQSRSSSVVVAALMAMPRLAGRQSLDADDALALVREQRPIVRPNAGFMEQLRAAAWMDAAKIRALRIDATHA